MSCLSITTMMEPLVDACDGVMVNSNECKIVEFDLRKMKKEDVEFSTVYNLTFNRNDKAHALVSWFDV